ncbi:alpha/beta fold hydrolase [Corynebacterium choanae]|uniref:Alpha/beta hydrolase family protein n=1 Tax=Corynebacterium choanae TaxID=1862358 RepID=A0A3G6J9U0_9CORY|nr:alpha/beta fold hydrolase [Corynebacterium choanae]AZA12794.1 Alpha/beta hydrolase family protein [Corynebacterium choanae]
MGRRDNMAFALLRLIPPQGQVPRSCGLLSSSARHPAADGNISPGDDNAPAGRPLIVVFHGAMSSAGNSEPLLQALSDAGFPVVAVSYGHRGTDGLARCVEDATAHVAALLPTHRPMVLIGHSLGAWVATQVAFDPRIMPQVRGIIGLAGVFREPARPLSLAKRLLVRVFAGKAAAEFVSGTLAHTGIPPEAIVSAGIPVWSLRSTADTIVPLSCSALGKVHTIAGVSHAAMARVTAPVVQWCQAIAVTQ